MMTWLLGVVAIFGDETTDIELKDAIFGGLLFLKLVFSYHLITNFVELF